MDGFFARFYPHGKKGYDLKAPPPADERCDIRFEDQETRDWWIESRGGGMWYKVADAYPLDAKDAERWNFHEEIENEHPEWFDCE